MKEVLLKLFVLRFYKANAGFFLAFFFIFFGSVNGGSLISYHTSLFISMLSSWKVLAFVSVFWTLYAFKCTTFSLRVIGSADASFLYNIQTISRWRLLCICLGIQTALFLPLLGYGTFMFVYGVKHQYQQSAIVVLALLAVLNCAGSIIVFRRLTNWMQAQRRPLTILVLPKAFPLYILHHLTAHYKILAFGLKVLSGVLLYLVLVWNAGKIDNDSFLLFYLLITLAHFIIPFFSVSFIENQLAFCRNLPLNRFKFLAAYLLTYAVFLLPELIYLLLYGRGQIGVATIFYYYSVSITSLFLLTAVQYTEATNRREYMKVGFALFFVSIFMLHSRVFLFWTCLQFAVAFILFWTGFYSYSKAEE